MISIPQNEPFEALSANDIPCIAPIKEKVSADRAILPNAPLRNGTAISEDWSGRWESNPRHTAWEAVVLPLNYARTWTRIAKSGSARQALRLAPPVRTAGKLSLQAKVTPVPTDDIEVLSPPGAVKPTGTWNVGVRAGDFVFVAGMRGIDPATNLLVDGAEARIRQAFLNMKTIVEAAGGTLGHTARLVVYVTDM